MSTIGAFTKYEDGSLRGAAATLTIRFEARFIPVTRPEAFDPNYTGPQYRLLGGSDLCEIGAAWIKEAKTGNEYMFVVMDGPSFPAQIAANLFHQPGGAYNLVWSRGNGRWSRPVRRRQYQPHFLPILCHRSIPTPPRN